MSSWICFDEKQVKLILREVKRVVKKRTTVALRDLIELLRSSVLRYYGDDLFGFDLLFHPSPDKLPSIIKVFNAKLI